MTQNAKPEVSSNPDSPNPSNLLAFWQTIRFNSFGFRLFSMILGGALVGIGGMAFLFGETIKYQAEEQIQSTLEGKVNAVDDILDYAESLSYGLGVSTATLHVRGAETPGTYQELARQLFQGRADFVVGLGFGQKPNGVLPSQQWFFPYYQTLPGSQSDSTLSASGSTDSRANSRADSSASRQTERPEAEDQYIDRAEQPYFYPDTEIYSKYFQPGKNIWTEPYRKENSWIISYYSQITNSQGEWLGTTVVDMDSSYLAQALNQSVLAGKGHFLLISESGQVIANPTAQNQKIAQTYRDIADLGPTWAAINPKTSGFIEGEEGYWSYAPVPEHDWLILAYVPYSAVFNQLALTTLSAAALVTLLLGSVVALAVRYLNHRLRPVINECQRLSSVDEAFSDKLKNKDELEQLSLSFFNLIEQLKLSRSEVQKEAAHALAAEKQLERTEAQVAAARIRQQQVTQRLKEMLPSESEQALENKTLKRELAQLSEVVSTLATDDLLFSAIASSQEDTLTHSESDRISHRLSHTFSQVLSALDHFSTLITLLSKVTSRITPIDQAIDLIHGEVEKQIDLTEQATQQIEAAKQFSQTLLEEISAEADGSNSATLAELAASRQEIDSVVATLAAFQQNADQLSGRIQTILDDTQQANQLSNRHQRMVTSAQVLLSNAAALSISASQKKDPEDFDSLIAEFRNRGTRLQQLAEEIAQIKPQQQDRSERLQATASDLALDFSAFRQSAQSFNGGIDACKKSLEAGQAAATHIVQEDDRIAQSSQQLMELLKVVQQSVREMNAVARSTQGRVDAALQQTQQVEYLARETTGTTATFLLTEGR